MKRNRFHPFCFGATAPRSVRLANSPPPRLRQNAGINLIELTIVLGVISLIIGAVWLVASVVYENVRQYNATHNMQTMVQNIRQLYTRISLFPASSVGENLTLTLDRQGAFPSDMRLTQGTNETTADGKINHPWVSDSSGSVIVTAVSTNSFGVRFSSMPKKACISMATKLSGGEITNLTELVINGNSYPPSQLPLTVVGAAVSCSNAQNNTLEWRFGLRG
jgi:type II secretory pathway pseudopilin PulG